MKSLLALFLVFLLTIGSYAALTPGKVPVTKTGGTAPSQQDSDITNTKGVSVNIGVPTSINSVNVCVADGTNCKVGGVGTYSSTYKRGVSQGKFTGSGALGFANALYTVPGDSDFSYWSKKGLNLVRLAFQWEYMQHKLNGDLDAIYLANLDGVIASAKKYGVSVILDCHNFGERLLYNDGGITEPFTEAAPTSLNWPYSTYNRDGSVILRDSGEAYLGTSNNPASGTGYQVSFNMRIDSRDYTNPDDGFYIRPMHSDQNSTSYYQFGAVVADNTWHLKKVVAGVTTTLASGSKTWNLGQTYAVVFDVEQATSGKVNVSIDSTPIFTTNSVNADAALTKGYVSFLPTNTHVKISSLVLNVQGDTSAGGITATYKVGSDTVPISALTDLWTKLATHYVNEPGIYMYDIMNEPYNMPIPMSTSNYIDTGALPIAQAITNTNFASGSTTGWTLGSDFTASAGTGYSGDGNSGAYSVAESSAGGFALLTTGTLTVLANTDYTFSFYYKISAFTGNGYPTFNVWDTNTSGTKFVSSTAFTAAQATYARKSFSFNTGAHTSIMIGLQNNAGTGTANYDAFNLTKTSAAIPFTSGSTQNYNQSATVTQMYTAIIPAIRAIDTSKWIGIEYDTFSNAANFTSIFGANPSVWWTDTAGKSMISAHYYFDSNYSGTYGQAYSGTNLTRIPTDILPILNWGKAKGVPVFFGEYGSPNTLTSDAILWQACLEAFLTLLDGYNNNIATYWAAGNGYTGILTVQPSSSYTVDQPQTAILQRHLGYLLPDTINFNSYYKAVTAQSINWTDVKALDAVYGSHSGINWTSFGV